MLEDEDHDRVREQIQLATRLLSAAEDILEELKRRFNLSGLEEKAQRS